MISFFDRLSGSAGTFVIAEVGVNHNGDLDLAKQLIDVAVTSGADAVKFQTFFAEELVTNNARRAAYQSRNTGSKSSQFEMLKALELSEDAYQTLAEYCKAQGIVFLSTPFSEAAVDILEKIGVEGFKVSSGDLTHLPLLAYIAEKRRPVILSTGMGNLAEIEAALEVLSGCEVALLHCVSNYPADMADCNLRAIDTMRHAFCVPIGWSDHTLGATSTIAAVARGAQMIEKHFTLDRTLPGPDHAASLEPDELSTFVTQIRATEVALGQGRKTSTAAEQDTMLVARRSITLRTDLPAGHVLGIDDLVIRRPGTGLSPALVYTVLGGSLIQNRPAEHILHAGDFVPKATDRT
jgi:N,N'-diacetyllegionaminate synthase